MLKIERKGPSGLSVAASGNLESIHTELALLICTIGNKFSEDAGMSFDDFLVMTLMLAKKCEKSIFTIDMSDFNKFLQDLDLNL